MAEQSVRSEEAGRIVVTGDVTMDWNLAQKTGKASKGRSWLHDTVTAANWQRGGAALVADLVECIADRLARSGQGEFRVLQTGAAREAVGPGDEAYNHSFAFWKQYDGTSWSGGKAVWRMAESLGMSAAADCEDQATRPWHHVVDDTADAEIVVIDDAAYGFRECEALWPEAIGPAAPAVKPWVVLKMSHPLCEGKLWEHLLANFADRLIVIVTANDLRHGQIQISRQLSWERTAGDLVRELNRNPRINELRRCAHVVVSFLTAGAVVQSGAREGSPAATLLFDPVKMEGQWERPASGKVFGYTTILTAAIVRRLMVDGDQPDVAAAVQSGVRAMRDLFTCGYLAQDDNDSRVVFPHDQIADLLMETDGSACEDGIGQAPAVLQEATIPHPDRVERWSILGARYSAVIDSIAADVAQQGLDVILDDVPVAKFGFLSTVDRREIESYRNVHRLLVQYVRNTGDRQPCCIAVFGPPGSGKSFGVKQIAATIGKDKIKTLTFNLSQLASPSELNGALHQVRDVALTGMIPLVFWDEFDTALAGQTLGWLRYFLAPMQDGEFQEGQITHPIGKCIFVFAGGTSESFADFGSVIRGVNEQAAADERKAAKVNDFLSRLKGYLNVLGPNPQHGPGFLDELFILRRAILLRSMLSRRAKGLFEGGDTRKLLRIDPGVLRAFLHSPAFRHGARSMEFIIAMSVLGRSSCYERASLPSEAQLETHADGKMFLSLVDQISLPPELLEKVAASAHDCWKKAKEADGWSHAPVRDNTAKTHAWLLDYDELPEEAKEANRVTAGNFPRKLACCGYVMTPIDGVCGIDEFPPDDFEKMSIYEHELWMEDKLRRGYTLGESTEAEPYHSPYLVPWEELDDDIKQYDRDQIANIIGILKEVGYAVVKAD